MTKEDQSVLDAVLDKLAAIEGLECVTLNYSGSGDSGAFEDPILRINGADCVWRSTATAAEIAARGLEGLGATVLVPKNKWTATGWARLEPEETSLLEALIYIADRQPLGDYSNNEGGEGSLVFDVKAKQVDVHAGVHILTTEYNDFTLYHSSIEDTDASA